MAWRIVALALLFSLSPALSVRLAAQSADPAAIQPGELVLDLSPDAPSSLAVDRVALDDWLCSGGGEPDPIRGGGSSEDCRLVVGGTGSQNRCAVTTSGVITLTVSGPHLRGPDLGATATVAVTQLSLAAAEPLQTSCGSWSFEARLDGGQRLPLGFLVLEEARHGAATGLFVGTVAIHGELVLTSEDDSTTKVLPLPLELDLAGRWLALPAGNLEPGVTSLGLFLDLDGHDFVDRPSCAQERQRCGRLCLTAAPGTVDAANGLVP